MDVCDNNLGKCETVLSISAGTITMFPCSTFCLPRGAWCIFMKGNLTASNVSSRGFNCFKICWSGKSILFITDIGGIFPFEMQDLQV